jgi:hypothetical protein
MGVENKSPKGLLAEGAAAGAGAGADVGIDSGSSRPPEDGVEAPKLSDAKGLWEGLGVGVGSVAQTV